MNMIATKKLYQGMSIDEYNTELKIHINNLAPNYEQKSDVEKWDIINDSFIAICPPGKDYEEKFKKFQSSRKNTIMSLKSISLQASLMYFENFYFLYTTTDPHFKLTDEQKRLLLEEISDSMVGACETGISARFERSLQQYRTDLDWVRNALTKSRYLLVQEIQDRYNTINRIPDSLRTHVLKLMTQLAINRGLGIKTDHNIQDVHINLINVSGITNYFDQNYPQIFAKEYEDKILDILTNELVFQIQELHLPNWSKNDSTISEDRMSEFRDFINNRIGLEGVNAMEALGDFSENYKEFILKKKEEVIPIIRNLIKEKLVHEKYYVPFKELTRDNLDSEYQLCLKKGIKQEDLLKLNEAIINSKVEDELNLSIIIEKHAYILLQYPSIILMHIDRHPNLLNLIPNSLKYNAYFIDETITALTANITLAIRTNKAELQQELQHQLLIIAKSNRGCLANLSKDFLNDIDINFAKSLVEIDGNLFSEFPYRLKTNDEIIAAAIKQNSFAYLYVPKATEEEYITTIEIAFIEAIEKLPEEFKVMFSKDDVLNINSQEEARELISSIEKMHAIDSLLVNEKLNFLKVAEIAQILNPILLVKIINQRKKDNSPPLPFCNNINALNKFNNELSEQDIANWDKGIWHIKKQAAELNRFYSSVDENYNKPVIDNIIKNDLWLVALVKFQSSNLGAFKNLKQFWSQVKLTLKALFDLFSSLVKLAFHITKGILGVMAYNLLNEFIPGIFFLGIVAYNVVSLIRGQHFMLGTNPLALLLTSGLMYFTLDYMIALQAIVDSFAEFQRLVGFTVSAFKSIANLFSRVFQTILSHDDLPNINKQNVSLKTICEESILRLKLKEDLSAEKKALALELILTKINEEINIAKDAGNILPENEEKELARRLNLPYEILFNGELITASFYQVAAISRVGESKFEIPKNGSPAKVGFFKPTTMSILPKVKELDNIAMAAVAA